MLTKELFTKVLSSYNNFSNAIDRISIAITGTNYNCDIVESDWYEAVFQILEGFLKSHFNDNGIDLIYWWLFELTDKVITYKKVDGNTVDVDLTTMDNLWTYLISFKEDYFIE